MPSPDANPAYWFTRHSRSVIFLIVTLALIGGYLAFTVPVAVFPATNFPRILIAVDNGVMPIDQMMVTITRPLEEAVNSVPGLQNVRSVTSRGSAEIDLFFDWNVDMFQTLQYVNAALSRVQTELPPSAKIEAHRMTFASFPIIGYSLTSNTMEPTKLWELATYEIKPRLNRLDGVSTVVIQGGQEPEFHIIPDPAKLLVAGVTVPDLLEAVRRTNMIDSPGLLEENHQLILGLINGQVHTPRKSATSLSRAHQQAFRFASLMSPPLPPQSGPFTQSSRRTANPPSFLISTASRTATPSKWPTKCTPKWIAFAPASLAA